MEGGADRVVGAVGAAMLAAGYGDGREIVNPRVDRGWFGAHGCVGAVNGIMRVAVETGCSGEARVGGVLRGGDGFSVRRVAIAIAMAVNIGNAVVVGVVVVPIAVVVVKIVASTTDWHWIDTGMVIAIIAIPGIVVSVTHTTTGSAAREGV